MLNTGGCLLPCRVGFWGLLRLTLYFYLYLIVLFLGDDPLLQQHSVEVQ